MSEISLTKFLGTPIPSALTLFHDRLSRFSLQPSCPMNINSMCYDNLHAERVDLIQIWIVFWATSITKTLLSPMRRNGWRGMNTTTPLRMMRLRSGCANSVVPWTEGAGGRGSGSKEWKQRKDIAKGPSNKILQDVSSRKKVDLCMSWAEKFEQSSSILTV